MTRAVFGVAVLAVLTAARPIGAADRAASVDRYSEPELLRNWALARCLSRAFPGSPLEHDAAAAAGGYLEYGKVGADAYAQTETLVGDFLARTYQSQSGEALQTMKCIDLFHSPELGRLVRRYAGQRNRK